MLELHQENSESGSLVGTFRGRKIDLSWGSHDLYVDEMEANDNDEMSEFLADVYDAVNKYSAIHGLPDLADLADVEFKAVLDDNLSVTSLDVVPDGEITKNDLPGRY